MEEKIVSTKLTINLRDGIVQVEGSEDFVRSVYKDFKERVDVPLIIPPTVPSLPSQIPHDANDGATKEESSPRRKGKVRKSRPSEGKKVKVGGYKPTFNSKLNLGALSEFYDLYAPSNNHEKILVFAIFLRDHLHIDPCTVDDIYTCFFTLKGKTKIPEAFVQAFRDAQSRTHYIEMTSLDQVQITIPGQNYFSTMSGRGAS